MNAIVIVFMQGSDGQLITDQGAARRVVDLLPQGTYSDNTKAGLRHTADPDQVTPPFWTWFIENPPRRGVI